MKGPPKATSMELNLAPMVDVIMCMLIFFMLATKLVQQESSRIDLPLALAAKDVELADLGARFVVNVQRAAGDSSAAEYLVREQPVKLDALISMLQSSVSQTIKDSGPAAELNCIIRADKSVPYKHVEAIMKGCATAKVRNITFSALQGASGGA